MNPLECMYQSLSAQDDLNVKKFIGDSSSTMNVAISLMQLESDWMAQLESDRIQYVIDSISPDPATALLAQADQVQYNTDSMNKDTQCNLVQISVKTGQAQVNADTSNRQSAFGVVQGTNGALAFANSLIQQKY